MFPVKLCHNTGSVPIKSQVLTPLNWSIGFLKKRKDDLAISNMNISQMCMIQIWILWLGVTPDEWNWIDPYQSSL